MYQRAVQWLAQPITAAITFGATLLFHQNVSHNAAENVAVVVATYLVGLVAHASWFRNVPKWWEQQRQTSPSVPVPVQFGNTSAGFQSSVVSGVVGPPTSPESRRKPDPPEADAVDSVESDESAGVAAADRPVNE